MAALVHLTICFSTWIALPLFVAASSDAAKSVANMASSLRQLAVAGDENLDWVKFVGTQGEDYFYSTAAGTDGTVFVAGFTQGLLDESSGEAERPIHPNRKALLMKLSSSGKHMWSRHFNKDEGTSQAHKVKVSNNGQYVAIAGTCNGGLGGGTEEIGGWDAFIAVFKTDGESVMHKIFGTSVEDQAYGVAVADDGTVYLSGKTLGNLNGERNKGGYSDPFVIKVDSAGSRVWTKLFGTNKYDVSRDLAISKDDDSVIVVGFTDGNFDGSKDPEATDDDGFIVKLKGADGSEAMRMNLGSMTQQWDYIRSVATRPDGSFIVVGETMGSMCNYEYAGGVRNRDGYLYAYASDGTFLWKSVFGSFGDDTLEDVSIADDGTIAVTGYTKGHLDGNRSSFGGDDAVVALYTSEGKLKWTHQLGGTSHDVPYGVAISRDGSTVFVAGHTSGAFGGEEFKGGQKDGFVAKFSVPSGSDWPDAVPLGRQVWCGTTTTISSSTTTTTISSSTTSTSTTTTTTEYEDNMLMIVGIVIGAVVGTIACCGICGVVACYVNKGKSTGDTAQGVPESTSVVGKPVEESQMEADEKLARQLQAEEDPRNREVNDLMNDIMVDTTKLGASNQVEP